MEIKLILGIIIFVSTMIALHTWINGTLHHKDPIEQEPLLSEPAVLLDSRAVGKYRYWTAYYMDFLVPNRNIVVTCEVSKSIYSTLQTGYSGILTHKGGEFHSFLRNGEVFYEKC